MPISQNSRASLATIVEATFGTTPSTPTLITLPFATHSLDDTRQTLGGTDIRGDEMERFLRLGDVTVAGDITGDFRKGDYDTLLESVMRGEWATNVLKVGTTPKFMTIEETAADIDQFRQFKGMTANTMNIAVTSGSSTPVQVTFGMMGREVTQSATTVATTLTAASSNSPFDHHSGDFALGNVGSSSTACVTAISFDVARNYETTFCVGDPFTKSMVSGNAAITGTFTAYYEDETLLARYTGETLTELELSVDDETGANPYTFLFPSVKFTGAPVPVSGPTGARMVEIPFTALYDATEGSNLVITRTA